MDDTENKEQGASGLIFHPMTVADWLMGREIIPLELEISLVEKAADSTKEMCLLDEGMLLKNLRMLASQGLSSVVYMGCPSPLLHPYLINIISKTAAAGINTALITDGLLWTAEMAESCLEHLSWLTFRRSADETDIPEILKETLWRKEKLGLDTVIDIQSEQLLEGEGVIGGCPGLDFKAYIDAGGNVWPCVPSVGSEEFIYGNLYKNTFAEVWKGKTRKRIREELSGGNCVRCGKACRMVAVNRYLNELCHPGEHINFI